MAKLNHAKIIKGFEELINTTNGKDFFVGFLKTFSFPASTIRNVQDPNNGRNIAIADGDYGLAKNMYFRPIADGQDVRAVVLELVRNTAIAKHKVRFFMATDFKRMAAYDARVDDWADFDFCDLKANYEFFLPLTGLYEKPLAYSSHPADVKACEKMGKLYDIIRATNKYDDDHLHDLNVFLTRLLFCFFAEDTGIFPIKGQMTKAIEALTNADGSDMQSFFERLFWILDMAPDRYARKQETATLAAFPYVNGGLFRAKIRIPEFNARARNILLECGRLEWNQISPVIFGSMFQAVMKPEERHLLGAHYTSEQNIFKVIGPLFLDGLKEELAEILGGIKETQKKLTKDQSDKLYAYQGKLATLTFLDPACGSGNFLIVSFRELKKLEFETVKALHRFDDHGRSLWDDWKLEASKVSINQFYGIEIEEFPVEVARVSMWLMEHVMNVEFGKFFGASIPTIPLKDTAHIVCENALTFDWSAVTDMKRLAYIMGNPPFIGRPSRTKQQKEDLAIWAEDIKNGGNLDYVTAWYLCSSKWMDENNNIEASFVSTNSICQGEQVVPLWKTLFSRDIKINFAHQTFKWRNEASDNAGVSCVIIGFSKKEHQRKALYVYNNPYSDFVRIDADHINGFLIDSDPEIFVEERRNPFFNDVPTMMLGNQPTDNGNLIIELDCVEPFFSNAKISPFIKKLLGSNELINRTERYCLWLVGASEDVLNEPILKERIDRCREFRLASKKAATRKDALRPHLFQDRRFDNPPKQALVIPRVSSERRRYIPMTIVLDDTIVNDRCYMIPNVDLYTFGILNSRMHMVWMNTTSGRLESRINYSRDLCYNTFPWPDAKETQRKQIEILAQNVLDARDFYPELTLADLYDPESMPQDLKEAHDNLDRAVEQLYRSRSFDDDEQRLQVLFNRYQKLVADGL